MLLNMPTRWAAGRGPETEHVRDQLSAYLDYELPELARDQVREHVRRCPECENELATLKATKQLLAEIPLQPVPRSFILTPDMVGRTVSGPVVVPQRSGWSLAGRLRVAALGFAAILVVMLSSEYLFQGSVQYAAAPGPNISTGVQPITAPKAGFAGDTANAAPAATDTTTAPAAAAATSTTAAAAPAGTSTTAPAAASSGAPPAVAGDQAAPTAVSPPSAYTLAPAASSGAPPALAGDQAAPTAVSPPSADTLAQQTTSLPPGGAGGASTVSPPGLSSELRTSAQPTAVPPALVPAPPPPAAGLQITGWRLVEGGLLLLVLALIGASLWAARPRS